MNELSRADKIKYINSGFVAANNNQVNEMYERYIEDIEYNKNNELNRRVKINHILDNINYADDQTIDDLFDYAKDNNLLIYTGIKISVIEEEKEEDTTAHDILINVLNDLLEVMGKNKIQNLEDFKDIRREELVKKECEQVITNNEEYIFGHFKKSKLGYYTRNAVKSYILTILKNMVKEIDNYKFVSKNHKNKKKSDKTNYTTYCIKKTQ